MAGLQAKVNTLQQHAEKLRSDLAATELLAASEKEKLEKELKEAGCREKAAAIATSEAQEEARRITNAAEAEASENRRPENIPFSTDSATVAASARREPGLDDAAERAM